VRRGSSGPKSEKRVSPFRATEQKLPMKKEKKQQLMRRKKRKELTSRSAEPAKKRCYLISRRVAVLSMKEEKPGTGATREGMWLHREEGSQRVHQRKRRKKTTCRNLLDKVCCHIKEEGVLEGKNGFWRDDLKAAVNLAEKREERARAFRNKNANLYQSGEGGAREERALPLGK